GNSSYSTNIGYPGKIRPVKCGNDGVLIVSGSITAGNAGTVTAKLIRYAANAASYTVYTSSAIPGLTDISQLLSLVSYDNGGGKYVLFYSSGANGAGDLYALPLTVNPDNTVTSGALQTLPAGSIVMFGHVSGGSSIARSSANTFLFSADASLAGMPTITTAAQFQTAAIDSNGVVAMGGKFTLPVGNGYDNTTSAQTGASDNPVLFARQRSDGNPNSPAGEFIITGLSMYAPYRHMFFDVTPNGGGSMSLPFAVLNPTMTSNMYVTRCLAIENPAGNGEFLFAEHNNSNSIYQPMNYYFGYLTDAPNPANIIGVALDGPDGNGFVKVQTTPKVLPNILPGGGLIAGMQYIPGANGTLAQYAGTGTVVGMGVAAADFAFGGAVPLLS
ncbi:MAG: hypothetical protein FWD71_12880, partial [Oscillospiraceae bacterium]|nr:hypothetical protein [Oscillospiraceae bacterium]